MGFINGKYTTITGRYLEVKFVEEVQGLFKTDKSRRILE